MIYSEKNRKQAVPETPAFATFEPMAEAANEPAGAIDDVSAVFAEADATLNAPPVFEETTFEEPPFEDSALVQSYAPRLPMPMPKRKNKLIKPWGYVGLLLLFAIPVIGFICLLVFCFSNKDRNRKNFARGYFLTGFIGLLLTAGLLTASYFLVLQPELAKLGGGLNAVGSMVNGYLNNDTTSLDQAQLSALQSGDLSGLTQAQKDSLQALLATMDSDLLAQYLPNEDKPAGSGAVITGLPAPLPNTLEGKPTSVFTTTDGEQFYTVFNVTQRNHDDFAEALVEAGFEAQASTGDRAHYFNAAQNLTAELVFNSSGQILTLYLS